MNLFEYASKYYRVYPEILGYFYFRDIQEGKVSIDEINDNDFVFISSDFSSSIPGCKAKQIMTSAELVLNQYMWLEKDFSSLPWLSPPEYTDIPVVGFVGRCPVFHQPDGSNVLHRGFEYRYHALMNLNKSNEVCTDYHIRFNPEGDSCGFWNNTMPDWKKNQPLFISNMFGCQYQVCARGNANWSLRFFETLACSRIPIYIESGGQLPFGRDVNWLLSQEPPFPVVLPDDNIVEVLTAYHEKHKEHLWAQMEDCYKFFKNHFTQESQINQFDAMFGGLKV